MEQEHQSPKLLSVKSVAAQLGIGTTSVYQLLYDGELRSVKLHRRRLIPAQDVADLAERLATNEYVIGQYDTRTRLAGKSDHLSDAD